MDRRSFFQKFSAAVVAVTGAKLLPPKVAENKLDWPELKDGDTVAMEWTISNGVTNELKRTGLLDDDVFPPVPTRALRITMPEVIVRKRVEY